MTQLQTLIEEIPKYQPGADLEVLERAYRFSERSHQGQQRASGEPYVSHPLHVAGLLVDFKMDVTTVTAGLLHDVLEDTSTTKADLEAEFGKDQIHAYGPDWRMPQCKGSMRAVVEPASSGPRLRDNN